eukprot:1342699-Prymnesium_polylepis.4
MVSRDEVVPAASNLNVATARKHARHTPASREEPILCVSQPLTCDGATRALIRQLKQMIDARMGQSSEEVKQIVDEGVRKVVE